MDAREARGVLKSLHTKRIRLWHDTGVRCGRKITMRYFSWQQLPLDPKWWILQDTYGKRVETRVSEMERRRYIM